MTVRTAISKIDRKGCLLVYPLQNRPEPPSLWSEFFPRTKMRWDWDEGSDDRVAQMWRLRERISSSGKAVYAKWYQGRATFFSRDLFPLLVCALGGHEGLLSQTARQILHILEEDSPLSTKELKRRADLKGKDSERIYEKALKELWSRLFIVGYGEVDDGAFPSLAMGATSVLFDDLWAKAQAMEPAVAEKQLLERLGPESSFFKQFLKLKAGPRPVPVAARKGFLSYEDLVKK